MKKFQQKSVLKFFKSLVGYKPIICRLDQWVRPIMGISSLRLTALHVKDFALCEMSFFSLNFPLTLNVTSYIVGRSIVIATEAAADMVLDSIFE